MSLIVTDLQESAAVQAASPGEAEPFRRVAYDLRDGQMAGIAFGDESRPVDIVFLHANGLNARAYRTLLAPLGERYHVVAFDLRGHGRSTLKPRRFGYDSWRRHSNDLIGVLDAHFTRPVTLAGHSMGAVVSLQTAARRPDLVGGVAMIDPAILSDMAYFLADLPGGVSLLRAALPIAAGAAKRRAHFQTVEEVTQALTGRGFFENFSDEALADYIADGFVPDPHGGVRLACSPAYEAASFAAQRNNPWAALKRFRGPLVLLRAEHGSTISGAAAKRVAAMKPDTRIALVEGSSHALPMERPDRVRSAIEAAALMVTPAKRFTDLV